MRTWPIGLATGTLLVTAAAACGRGSMTDGAATAGGAAVGQLTSAAFDEGGPIPPRYTCDGDDTSPPLAWSGTPEATVELALIVDDPDAGGFVHWVAFGIPAAPPGRGGIALRSARRGT